jgi:hypothetical protein
VAPRPGTAAWWFRDRRTGETVVAQFPNAPLWVLLAAMIVRAFLADGSRPWSAASWIGVGALCWWALDEVLRGVNPWRRLLGVAGAALAASWISRLVLGS